jgi:hypothetical protein
MFLVILLHIKSYSAYIAPIAITISSMPWTVDMLLPIIEANITNIAEEGGLLYLVIPCIDMLPMLNTSHAGDSTSDANVRMMFLLIMNTFFLAFLKCNITCITPERTDPFLVRVAI